MSEAERDVEQEYVIGVVTGDLDLVRAALLKGVPVVTPLFGHGATVLVWAVNRSEEMVRFLLERGAPVNAAD